MNTFSLGDDPQMAEELLDLVLKGKKTATSWATVHGELGTSIGSKHIITDSKDTPKVLIETTALIKFKFSEVRPDIAKEEGEGDLSTEYWEREHERYFRNEGTFSADMEVYCQKFKVIKIL